MQVDPGAQSPDGAQLTPDARQGGLVPGLARSSGRGGRFTFDAVDVGGDTRGNGQLAARAPGTGDSVDPLRQADVPPSLRAFVRRYLEGLSGNGAAPTRAPTPTRPPPATH